MCRNALTSKCHNTAVTVSTPLIRMLLIQIANYLDWLGLSGKFVKNSAKLTCLDITGCWIKYETVLWLLEIQIRRDRKVYS